MNTERVMYFALWPPLYQSVERNICSPTTGGEQKDVDSVAMNIIGSLPPWYVRDLPSSLSLSRLTHVCISLLSMRLYYHVLNSFFLSAFSINVFTFARIYHTVLAGNEGMTKCITTYTCHF
jgi:hypothetical protein